MSSQPVTLTVNGRQYGLAADPSTPLLQVLRQELGLKSAKHACGLEQCGACKVLVNGAAVPSCMLPVGELDHQQVVTVEGLATDGILDPLQQAFVAENAIQCGYCVAGMLMAGKDLLARNPRPGEQEIREAVHRNLCRCGVYNRVVRAIQRASGQSPSQPIYMEVQPDDNLSPPDSLPEALPASLQDSPDLDDWIRFRPDGVIDVFTGKVELGQGIVTALAQVVAEEMDVRMDQLRIHTADTARTPDEGATAGSMSLEMSGGALRQAAAEVRYHLLTLAAEEWNVPWSELVVRDGQVQHAPSGRQISYGQLAAGQPLAIQASGVVPPKPYTQYTLVGQPVTRLDIENKVHGRPSFLHDMDLPAMLHGRIVRGPYAGSRLTAVDADVLAPWADNVQLVQDGGFLAILSDQEAVAIQAAAALQAHCHWETEATLPNQEDLFAVLQQSPSQDFLVLDGLPVDDPIPALPPGDPARTVQGRFHRPYHMHAALGPSCGLAQYTDGILTVWSHSQGIFQLREAIAQVLDLPVDKVRVIHREGPGCYGHNGADDAAFDACLLAMHVPGRSVRVQWSHRDEFLYEPYGTPMVMEVTAHLDAASRLAYWRQDIWSHTHMGRPEAAAAGEATLLAAWHLATPFVPPRSQPSRGRHVGLHRNGTPQYRVHDTVTVKRFLPDAHLRVSSMRSLGAYANLFAIESMMDELAWQAGQDPVAFRLQNLDEPRGQAVIRQLAARMDWSSRHRDTDHPHRGWGMAYGRYKNLQAYVAIGVILTVDPDSGLVTLEQGFIAADAGHIVNPDGLSAQLEGSFIQAASWTLCEEVVFNDKGVTSTDWETYPILRATQVPPIHVDLIRRDGYPVMGAGEAAMCPVPAALANAIRDAVGVRLYTIPFTPARVRQALSASPAA